MLEEEADVVDGPVAVVLAGVIDGEITTEITEMTEKLAEAGNAELAWGSDAATSEDLNDPVVRFAHP